MSKLETFGVNSNMLATFYNAVLYIHNLIMVGSVCWGGKISNYDAGIVS